MDTAPKYGDSDNTLLAKIAGALSGFSSSISGEAASDTVLAVAIRQTFPLLLAKGSIPGMSVFRLIGHNFDLDTGSVPEDLWDGGGIYPFQSSAQSLEAVSANAADTAAGTGLRTALVVGLDNNFQEISETVTFNGGTVNLVNQYRRILSITGKTSGSGLTNAGDITFRVSGGGAIQGVMVAGEARLMQVIYTVPAGKTALLASGRVQLLKTGGGPNGYATLSLQTRAAEGIEPWIARSYFSAQSTGSTVLELDPDFFLVAPEKTDMKYTVRDVGTNDTQVSSTLQILILDNAILGL